MIPNKNYTSDEIFNIEQRLYFSKNFCLGTNSDLLNPGDYKTINSYFEPLTIRNVGEVKVFSNVCLHRSGLIDIQEHGNAPFSCKYHGWTYGADGELLRTPLDESMKSCNRKLDVIPSKAIDGFIFIKAEDDLETKYGGISGIAGMSKGNFFYRNSILHQCNWKLLVENVLEPYHISFVHKDSFVAMGLSSTSHYSWGENPLGTFNNVASKSDETKYYNHVAIGSNLFVSNTSGAITFVSYFFPISANQTLLVYELWESEKLMLRPGYAREKVRSEAISFSNKVLQEDREIIEAAQIGISHSKHEYVLSEINEPRLLSFHRYYQRAMTPSL
jgi:phenylpropionate dioxygenase-like ring-hydroxylating dioxygenase large terminal subunit